MCTAVRNAEGEPATRHCSGFAMAPFITVRPASFSRSGSLLPGLLQGIKVPRRRYGPRRAGNLIHQ